MTYLNVNLLFITSADKLGYKDMKVDLSRLLKFSEIEMMNYSQRNIIYNLKIIINRE